LEEKEEDSSAERRNLEDGEEAGAERCMGLLLLSFRFGRDHECGFVEKISSWSSVFKEFWGGMKGCCW